jgi:hypothetical protein
MTVRDMCTVLVTQKHAADNCTNVRVYVPCQALLTCAAFTFALSCLRGDANHMPKKRSAGHGQRNFTGVTDATHSAQDVRIFCFLPFRGVVGHCCLKLMIAHA